MARIRATRWLAGEGMNRASVAFRLLAMISACPCGLAAQIASELLRRVALENRGGRREGRVPVAPMVRVQQKARGRTTGTNRINRPSLRNGFNGLLRALPGEPGFLATVTCATRKRRRKLKRQRRGARTTRLGRPRARRSSAAAPASTASRLDVRDDAFAPLIEAGRPEETIDLG
jgi:hypothetical protein